MTRPTEDKREPVYAWIVLAAIAFIIFLAIGQTLSYGLIYVELLDVYQEGPIRTTLITVVFSVCVALLGPVCGYLGDRFSTRVFIIAAGLIACAGLLLSSFAPSVTVLIVTYGFLIGSSDAAAFSNSLATVNKYFQRNRGLANGIALASGGVGTILQPFLFQYLIEMYSVRGLFMILAGLWLNLCVAGALIRPKTASVSNETTTGLTFSAERIYGGWFHPDILQRSKQTKYKVQTSKRNIGSEVEKVAPEVITISVISLNGPSAEQGNTTPQPGESQESAANSSHKEVLGSRNTNILNMIKHVCSLPFCALLMSDFLANVAYNCTLMFLPAHLIDNGYGSTTVTMCLSLIGGMDIVGKLGFGCFGDRGILNVRTLLAGSLTVGGSAMCFLAFNQPFTLVVVWCVVLGSFSGAFAVFRGPILTSIVGKQYIGAGYGFFALCFGAASAVGQLMFSTVKELTGAYTGAFIASGCCMFLGAVITLISRICLRSKPRQN